jgi:hypothetical protein
MYPVRDDCNGDGDFSNDRTAYQQPYVDTNGDGIFERSVDQPGAAFPVGCFVFHAAHDHWHFEDFARYELHARTRDGALVASTEKVSFCVLDNILAFPNVPGARARPYYGECHRSSTVGLSVGWGDIYTQELQGQALDITGLARGRYCLVSTADPDARITESDDTDNVRALRLRIRGTQVSTTGRTC